MRILPSFPQGKFAEIDLAGGVPDPWLALDSPSLLHIAVDSFNSVNASQGAQGVHKSSWIRPGTRLWLLRFPLTRHCNRFVTGVCGWDVT